MIGCQSLEKIMSKAKKPYKAYCYIGKEPTEDKPITGCFNCKHNDKYITEEPCMICDMTCNKWEKQ